MAIEFIICSCGRNFLYDSNNIDTDFYNCKIIENKKFCIILINQSLFEFDDFLSLSAFPVVSLSSSVLIT